MTRVAVLEVPWDQTLASRMAIACTASLLLAYKTPRPSRADLPALIGTLLGVVFGFPVLMTAAMQTAPAAHGAVVVGLLPLATAAASVLINREHPPPPLLGRLPRRRRPGRNLRPPRRRRRTRQSRPPPLRRRRRRRNRIRLRRTPRQNHRRNRRHRPRQRPRRPPRPPLLRLRLGRMGLVKRNPRLPRRNLLPRPLQPTDWILLLESRPRPRRNLPRRPTHAAHALLLHRPRRRNDWRKHNRRNPLVRAGRRRMRLHHNENPKPRGNPASLDNPSPLPNRPTRIIKP